MIPLDVVGRVNFIQNTIRVTNFRGLGTLAYQSCQILQGSNLLRLSLRLLNEGFGFITFKTLDFKGSKASMQFKYPNSHKIVPPAQFITL